MYKKPVVWLLFLIIFIDATASGLFIPVVTKLLTSPGFTMDPTGLDSTQNVIFGTFFIIVVSPTYFFVAPFIGSCSDNLGRKRVLLFCLLSTFVGYLLSYVSILTSIAPILVIGCFLTSVGSASLPVALAAVSDVSWGRARLYGFGLLSVAMVMLILLGIASGFLLDAQIFKKITPDYIVIAAVVLEGINIAMTVLLLRETKPKAGEGFLQTIRDVPVVFIEISQKKAPLIALGLIFCLQFSWGLYLQDTVHFAMSVAHFSDMQASIYLAYIALSMIIGFFIIFPFVNRAHRKLRILRNIFILMTIGLLGVIFLHSAVAQYLLVIPTAAGAVIAMPLLWYILSRSVPKEYHGLAMGASGSVWALAWVLSGLVADLFLKINTYFPAIIVLLIFCTITYWLHHILGKNNGKAASHTSK